MWRTPKPKRFAKSSSVVIGRDVVLSTKGKRPLCKSPPPASHLHRWRLSCPESQKELSAPP